MASAFVHKYNGYYSLDNLMVVKLTPDSITTYTIELIAISKQLTKDFKQGLLKVLQAEDLELLLVKLELVELKEEELETLKLLYSVQSTESTVEALDPSTVSGSDQGGKNGI